MRCRTKPLERCLAWMALAALTVPAAAQGSASAENPTTFDLFPTDPTCVCLRTHSETPTVKSSEVRVEARVFQVFTDKKQNHELFRIAVGRLEAGSEVKYWNYGIAVEGDFNHDGQPDYSWYGGDDTSDEMYVFLSSRHGYRKLGVYKTLQEEWVRRFRATAPDLGAADDDCAVRDVAVVRHAGRTTLEATVTVEPSGASRSLRVPEGRFVFVR